MSYIEKYTYWSTNSLFDNETKNELLSIKDNDKEIEDRFYKDLEFGTAGLRGVIGNGSNRMNKYTVGKATQGLASFINSQNIQNKSVVIAHDSRNMSKEFTEIAATCLNANGIKTYVFKDLKPTPVLSFATRELKCTAGIVITASHNPPEYNGFKVYWSDGAQISSPIDTQIIDSVNNIIDYSTIKTMTKKEAISKELFNILDNSIEEKYLNELISISLNKNIIKEFGKDIKIVYTPLHGTGAPLTKKLLERLGFSDLHIVKEQELPDGNFPTVDYPNPEDIKSFTLAISLAEKIEADIVLANDPDADRLGLLVKDSITNTYIPFNGNMTAMLIAEYILSQRKEQNLLPKNGAFLSTIVSTNLARDIAENYNLTFFETLTGFKHMGKLIKSFETNNSFNFQFGFEESYGCLIGNHARDKDGIVAIMFLCEAAIYYKEKGLTLLDQMQNIYKKYGYYLEDQKSISLKGLDGNIKMKNMLKKVRNSKPKTLGGLKVISIKDYDNDTVLSLKTNKITSTGLPKSNVIYYELENNSWSCIRPSGTEPKLKIYAGVKEKDNISAKKKLEHIINATSDLLLN